MSELSPSSKRFARNMLEHGIIRFDGKYTLNEESESCAYADLKEMISIPELFSSAISAYRVSLLESKLLIKQDGNKRFLAGVPLGGTLFVGAVAEKLKIPQVQRRVNPKTHGKPKQIEGRYNIGDQVILLDDVITSGKSALQEIEKMEREGLKIDALLVIIDRERGGREKLEARGIDFIAPMTISAIAKYALDENLAGVTQTLYDDFMGELQPKNP